MKQNELKIGDRVKLKKDSRYYNDPYSNNPRDTEGVVIEIRTYRATLPVRIRWDNSTNNTYEFIDLELLKEQPEFKILSYINKRFNTIWKLNEEREQYFHNNIYLRDTKNNALSIHSVMNKDGNTFDIGDEITLIEGVNKGNRFTITGFRMKKDGSTVCAITNIHTPYGVGINRIEHFIEKEPEFILPEIWWVKVTDENKEILSEWRFDNTRSHLYSGYLTGICKVKNNRLEKGHNLIGNTSSLDHKYYTYDFGNEITFEQFKKYVLKEEVVEETIIEETLLEKAKRLYPVGTVFNNHNLIPHVTNSYISSGRIRETRNGDIYVNATNRGDYTIYRNGEWAEIIEEVGPKVGDKFQIYTQPYTTFERRMSEYVHTIEKFEGSLRNPNSVISFTGDYPGAKTQTVLLKNVKFIKDEK